jgi:hypothetical protein
MSMKVGSDSLPLGQSIRKPLCQSLDTRIQPRKGGVLLLPNSFSLDSGLVQKHRRELEVVKFENLGFCQMALLQNQINSIFSLCKEKVFRDCKILFSMIWLVKAMMRNSKSYLFSEARKCQIEVVFIDAISALTSIGIRDFMQNFLLQRLRTS